MPRLREPTTPGPCRRFALLDAMLAVAVIAVGCTGLKAGWELSPSTPRGNVLGGVLGPVSFGSRFRAWLEWGDEAVNFAGVLAAYLVLAWRLIWPRPPLGWLVRQWGAAACLGVVVPNMVANLVTTAVASYRLMTHGLLEFPTTFGAQLWVWLHGQSPPMAILAGWLVLAVSGLGRSEPGWIDRAGRGVGWFWLASTLVGPLLPWLVPM